MDYDFSIKSVDDKEGIIEGYGSVFNDKDSYGDITIKDAFTESLAKHKENGSMPLLLWQHNTDEPIGKWVDMSEDDKGLKVKGKLFKDNIRKATEAFYLLKEKAISGLSIGYSIVKEKYDNETKTNILEKINLHEVSLVSFPALPSATVTNVKALNTIRDFENLLKNRGFSNKDAKIISSSSWEYINKDDSKELDEIKSLLENRLNIYK